MPQSSRRAPAPPRAGDPQALPAAWSLEDWVVLAAALVDDAAPGPVMLPCGPGDDALDLLVAGASAVIAVSPDPGSLALAELKVAAARTFPVWNLRSLLGLDAFGRRVFLYHYIRDRKQEGRGPPPPELSERARAWWDAHEADVRVGISQAGALEEALAAFRRHLARLGLAGRVRAAVEEGRALSGRRFSLACRLGLPAVATALDPALSAGLLRRRLAEAPAAPGDPLRRWVLLGDPGDLEAHRPYLSTEGHAALVAAADGLTLVHAPLVEALAARAPASLGGLHAGVLPADDAERAALLAAAAAAVVPGGRLLLRDPHAGAPEDPGPGWRLDPERTAALRARDRHPLVGGLVVAVRADA